MRISPDRDALDKLDGKLAQVGISRLSKAMVTETGYSSLEPSSRLNVNSSHFLPELRNENKTESKLQNTFLKGVGSKLGKLDAPSSTKASKNFLAHNATANIFFREEGKFKSGSKLDSMLASPQAIIEEKTGM